MRIRFIYKKEPRQFNYKPRYYDPDKEALERRKEELLGARPSGGEYVPGAIIRSKAAARQANPTASRSARKGRPLRTIAMVVLIGLIAYLIFTVL